MAGRQTDWLRGNPERASHTVPLSQLTLCKAYLLEASPGLPGGSLPLAPGCTSVCPCPSPDATPVPVWPAGPAAEPSTGGLAAGKTAACAQGPRGLTDFLRLEATTKA